MAKVPTLVERHIKALTALKGKSVEAGWLETSRYTAGGSGKNKVPDSQVGQPIAKIMRIQEFGATIRRGNATIVIPARPFMRLAWSNFGKSRKAIQKAIARDLVRGKITPDQALGQIGLAMEGFIVESMKNGGWAPNAASTVAKKGFDKPLIDSAQALQGVTSQVK
jgi:hypothetical protein